MDNPYSILWDPQYAGKVGIYDSYRDAIGMVLLKNGIDNVNTENASDIDVAKNDLLAMIQAVNIRYSINGSYAKLPKGEYYLHQSWSGDIVAGWGYTPHADEADYETLGYWYPNDRIGVVDNDLIAIPSSAPHPVLAHKFLNFMLDYQHAMDNFSWNGYQPPQKQAEVSKLTTTEGLYSKLANWASPAMYVPPWMPNAVVREGDLANATSNYRLHELSIAGDTLWQDAWQEFKAGA
jgi:spermidine/putrescine transport system substrate-binding protein